MFKKSKMEERRGSHENIDLHESLNKVRDMSRRRWSVDHSSLHHLPLSLNLTLRSKKRSIFAGLNSGSLSHSHLEKIDDVGEMEHNFFPKGFRQNRRSSLQKLFHISPSKKKHHDPALALVFHESGKSVLLSSEDGTGLREVLSQASMEHRISSYRVIMDTTRSLLNSDSSSGSPVLDSGLEDVFDELGKQDDFDVPKVPDNRRDIVQELLKTEKEYCKSLRGILDTYAEPLRKFSSLTNEDHMILFVGLEPIISFSHMLTTKIEDCLKSWDTRSTQIGSLFNNKKLWSVHEEYCSGFPKTKQFLEQKLASDDSLVQFCNLRRGQATQDLQSLLYLPVSTLLETYYASFKIFRMLDGRAAERIQELKFTMLCTEISNFSEIFISK